MRIKIVKNKSYEALKPLYEEFEVSEKGEVCLAVGGDGAFVRAAKEFDGPILPVRSGERGSIGYYADVGIGDIKFIANALMKRAYSIETLGNRIEIRHKNKVYHAINEALLPICCTRWILLLR